MVIQVMSTVFMFKYNMCQHNSSICIFKESKEEECDGSSSADDGHQESNASRTRGKMCIIAQKIISSLFFAIFFFLKSVTQ